MIEPFGNAVTIAQVGVLWFHLRALGAPAHVAEAPDGVERDREGDRRAPGLRELERELNAEPPPPYDAVEHPINLNLGVIRGGDWPSTVAGDCRLSCRIALYPGQDPARLLERIRERVGDEVSVEEEGFSCRGTR